MVQLDFFQNEEDLLFVEIQKVKESSDKVRKSIYARHNELERKYNDLLHRLDIFERHICRSDQTLNLI